MPKRKNYIILTAEEFGWAKDVVQGTDTTTDNSLKIRVLAKLPSTMFLLESFRSFYHNLVPRASVVLIFNPATDLIFHCGLERLVGRKLRTASEARKAASCLEIPAKPFGILNTNGHSLVYEHAFRYQAEGKKPSMFGLRVERHRNVLLFFYKKMTEPGWLKSEETTEFLDLNRAPRTKTHYMDNCLLNAGWIEDAHKVGKDLSVRPRKEFPPHILKICAGMLLAAHRIVNIFHSGIMFDNWEAGSGMGLCDVSDPSTALSCLRFFTLRIYLGPLGEEIQNSDAEDHVLRVHKYHWGDMLNFLRPSIVTKNISNILRMVVAVVVNGNTSYMEKEMLGQVHAGTKEPIKAKIALAKPAVATNRAGNYTFFITKKLAKDEEQQEPELIEIIDLTRSVGRKRKRRSDDSVDELSNFMSLSRLAQATGSAFAKRRKQIVNLLAPRAEEFLDKKLHSDFFYGNFDTPVTNKAS